MTRLKAAGLSAGAYLPSDRMRSGGPFVVSLRRRPDPDSIMKRAHGRKQQGVWSALFSNVVRRSDG